jgi:uncharacterized membrane protein YeaQ/YmgE (transglycosylase-associated protein family)
MRAQPNCRAFFFCRFHPQGSAVDETQYMHRKKRWKGCVMPSVDQLIVSIVVGLIGGGLAGSLITWERGGFGLLRNLVLGLAGAVVGGLLFRLFDILPALNKVAVSLRDIVAAIIGSLIVLAALWLWRRTK